MILIRVPLYLAPETLQTWTVTIKIGTPLFDPSLKIYTDTGCL